MIDLSVIIPFYNRTAVLAYSLESVRRAIGPLRVEVIIVDDGSTPPLEATLPLLQRLQARVIRQPNQGLLGSRLRGVPEAKGRYLLFLDTDDLVSPDKLQKHVEIMDANGADVSYSDTARTVLSGAYEALTITADPPLPATQYLAEFFITVQPAPHSPVWRTCFLRRVIESALFPPSPLYNSVAEIWFYHNAAVLPGKVQKIDQAQAIIGQHPGERLTNHWERLGVASLAVMEAFVRTCPAHPATLTARQLVAEKAFGSWRKLPRGFSPECRRRHLEVWRRLRHETRLERLGSGRFQSLARLVGPVLAARLLHLRNASIHSCQTLPASEIETLLGRIPPP